MDNQPDNDEPIFVPARRRYGVVCHVSERKHNRFPWLKLLFTAVAFVALFLVGRFLLVGFFISEYLHVGHQVARSMMAMDHNIQLQEKAKEEGGTVDGTTRSIVFSGPFGLPLSPLYRLQGRVQTANHDEYMATSLQGAYIMIPVMDCQLVDGNPYCKYHGYTVTGSSGTP